MKGAPKRVGPVTFWPNYEDEVPGILKEFIYSQYYSKDTLYVYCEMSMRHDHTTMAVACSYVKDGSVTVKHTYIHPPKESYKKTVYGEIKAVIFA